MKKLFFGLLILSTFSSVFAQNVRIRQNSFQKVSVSFAAETLLVDDISRTEGTFSVVSMDGYFPSNNPGDPQLPVLSKMLQIPVCDSVVATVTHSQYTEYDAADLGITYPLYPSQPTLPKNQVAQFTYNQSVYQTNAFYALPLVSVEKAGIKRNYALANVYVSPVQYNPVTQKIRIYTRIDVEFTFTNTDMEKTNRLRVFNSPMFSLDDNTVINKMSSGNLRVEFSGSSIKYMIVANSMFEGNEDLEAFIAWKKRLGYLVEVVYVNDGADSWSIKDIIQDEYENATAADPAPTFLLLVGDVDQIPAFTARDDNYYTFPTDLYYATLNGSDNLPDCYYGRLSATDNTQLSNQLEKIMMYEQYTMPDPSYLGKAVLIAGIDDYFSEGHSNTHANGQINYINQYYINANSTTHSYSTVYKHNYPYSDTYGSVAASSIISEISNGVGFANYTAHGYTNEWSLPHFGTDNIPSLANTNKYGLLIGNCCLSGKFDESECFGEALLRAPEKGAMGYIGASKESIWDCDYYWAVGVRSTIQNGTSYDASNLGLYDRLFHNHGEMQSVWVSTIGGMIQAGNMAVQYSTQSYYKKYYWEIYHCFGDPSVRVYLGMPDSMTVTAASNITPDAATYTATVAPYSYVALKLDDTTFVAAAFADENGAVTLTLPSDMEEGNYELVALAQNYIPYFKDVTIEIPGCAYPKNLTVSDITPYTAHISWTDGSGTFNLEIKEGDGNWTSLVTGLNASTYQLANLPDNTDFQVRVQSVCGETTGSWKTIRFSTPEACPTPTGLAGTFNGTSVNLTWTENGSATTWILQYGSQNDFAAGSYDSVTVTGAPSTTLAGLIVNSINYARVKSDCGSLYGESPWSDIYEFTLPNRVSVCEDFEGYAATAYDVAGVVPEGWSIIFTGDSLSYAPHVATGIDNNVIIANGNGLCFTAGRDEYSTYDSYGEYCYAVLPAHEGYLQSISFKYRFENASSGELRLGYITDITADSTFVFLQNVNTEHTEASYSLAGYNIPAGARLAFRWAWPGSYTTCGIDDVCVTYAYNQCLDMTEVAVSDVMPHSAQLSLEGSASSYNLRYRLTAISGDDNPNMAISGSWVQVEGVSSPYTLQGLIVESTYEVMAQAVCGEDEFGEWSSAVSFSTPGTCATPGNLAASNVENTAADLTWTGVQGSYDLVYRIAPHLGETLYFSGFETYGDLDGWAAIDYDEDGYYWSYYNSSYNEVPAHDGSGSMYSISLNPENGEPLHTDDWLISPQMVLGDFVSFWVRNHGMSDIVDSFMVFVLFENEEDLDVIDISPLEVATTDYVKYTVSLAPYAGEYGYIAIEHLGGAQLYLAVDDFRVFNADTLGGAWQTVEDVNSPYHLTGLTPDTKYEWYVIGKNCDGEGATTDPSQTSTFTTPEACPRPTNLVVNPVLTTAEVSWDGSSETYHLRYRVTIDGDTTSDSPWIMVDSVSSPYVINGLNTNTTYRVEVQSDCDEFLSDWNTYADFATLDSCGAPTDLDTSNVTALTADLSWSGVQESYHVQYRVAGLDPVIYFEDFESNPLQNGGWTAIDYDGDGYNWFVSNEGGISYSYCAASYVWESIGRRNLNPDNWLITPRIQLKDTLKVWLRGDGPYYPNDHFAIYATTGEPTVNNFLNHGTVLIPETITDHEYVQYTADLSGFQGWMGYIAIRHFNDPTEYRLDVDNFSIYGPDVSPGEWVDTIVTSNTLHITGLSQMTDYEWRVKGICENGETEWVESTFTTPYYCEPLTDFSIEYTGGADAMVSWTPENESARVMINGNVNILDWDHSPHYLYDLDTNTAYTVSLQRSCGAGYYSEWAAPRTFITDCSPEDKCELTFVLKDKGDDGWNGNAINVIEVATGNVIASMTNEDLNGTQNWGETEVNVKTLSVCDGRELRFVWAGNYPGYTNEISYEVYDVNEGLIFSGSGSGGGLPVDYTVSCAPHNCRKPTNLSAENITSYTADLNWDCSIDLGDYTVRYQTAGGINPVIYEEGFENGMGDWTTLDSYYLTHITDDTLYRVHTGQHAFSFSYNDESSTVNPQYLISSELPEIGEGTNLEFYYKSRSDIFSGYFQLGFSSTDTNTSSFTFRDTLYAHDGIWLHYNESIPAGTKYICWKFAADNLVLAIDDIKIGTYVAAGEWDSVTATTTGTTLTGLTPNRIYNVQVKSNCTGPELWSDVTTFTTGRDPKVYQIVNNVSDATTQMTWNQFTEKVYNGDFIPYDTVVLMEDITASTMAGTFDNPFISIFDGQGNTITFNYSGTVQGIAPFRCINGATIKNLDVKGSISTSAHHAAGLVGFANNTSPDVMAILPGVVNTIENCHVSVNVSSSFSKYIGGIVGHAKCVTTNIIGCVYDGELNSGGYKGGMFGWADWATLNVTNSFFKGTNAGNGTFDPVACKTHVYQDQTDETTLTVTLSNYYYNTDGNFSSTDNHGGLHNATLTGSGHHAYSVTGRNGATVAMADDNNTLYDVSGITASDKGIVYKDTVYAGSGETIALALGGSASGLYHADHGTLAENGEHHSLTMDAYNTVISPPMAYQIVTNVSDSSIQMTWDEFADKVRDKLFLPIDTILLMENISVTSMVASADTPFVSVFDGQGHTITVDYTATASDFTAPFRCIDGAEFKNLKVTGDINMGEHKFGAGFAGDCYGDNSFTNCVSDVTINSTLNGDGTHGGFIARNYGGTTYKVTSFTGCSFTGKLLGSNTTNCGGFCGWNENLDPHRAIVQFINCIFIPEEVTISTNGSSTFSRSRFPSDLIKTNIYYSQSFGTEQGKRMFSITTDEGVSMTLPDNSTVYELSGITAYSTGIVYNDTLYAGEGEALTLNLSGSASGIYEADHGSVAGTENPYTLVMEAYPAKISAIPCPIPSDFEIVDGSITNHSASLTWTGYSPSYNIQYRTTGEWQTISSNSTSVELTGLAPETDYEVRIQGVCGDNESSAWSGILTFRTDRIYRAFQIVNTVSDSVVQMTWEQFVTRVNNEDFLVTDTIALMEDISVSTMAGAYLYFFRSIFDGMGHTITVNYTAGEDYAAPFRYIRGATIKNLTVDGTINMGDYMYGGGFAGDCYGQNHFINCVSHVTINATKTGDGTHGGFVARNLGSNSMGIYMYKITFTACAFTGKLLGENTTNCGGFCGWSEYQMPESEYAKIEFNDCIFAPEEVTMSTDGSATFSCYRNATYVTVTNSYYTQTFGTAQGKQMYSVTGAEGVTVEMAGESTVYDVSGIHAYDTGLVYNGNIIAGAGDALTLNLAGGSAYTANHGTLSGFMNPHTLTMEAFNTVISITTPLIIIQGVTRTGQTGVAGQNAQFVNRYGQIVPVPALSPSGEILDE